MPRDRAQRAAYGDFQTSPELAASVLGLLRARGVRPRVVVEPTCGEGAFLAAAAREFPRARLLGLEVAPRHVSACRAALRGHARRAEVRHADFFETDWGKLARTLPEPVLLLGNPPWVTSAQGSKLGSLNAAPRSSATGLRGLELLTGKSNFDLAEWMLLRLIEAFAARDVVGAFLIKTSVARKLIEAAVRRDLPLHGASLHRIDAAAAFGVAVDAGLFVWRSRRTSSGHDCDVFESLTARARATTMGVRGGGLVADVTAWSALSTMLGRSEPEWRSGVKHDCAAVMELHGRDARLTNGDGEPARVDAATLFPLLKGSDVANGRDPSRFVVVTQRTLGEDTTGLRKSAPHTWRYLARHAARLDARKSSIYRGQPRFALFGVGPYTFSRWKVAVSALYKRSTFRPVGPRGNRPVLLDDTCYFVPVESANMARALCHVLNGPAAQSALAALVFPDAKRPLTKQVLMRLDFARLAQAALRGAAVPASLAPALRRLAGVTPA